MTNTQNRTQVQQTNSGQPAPADKPLSEFNKLLDKPHASKAMEFVPFAAEFKIKLTIEIVQKLLCERTRSGATCSEREATRFMMMCHARRLNPFEGDAFLIGYDTKHGPRFSLITAHQAFLKRAEVHPEYDGMESGIIIQNEDGSIAEVEGDFFLKGQAVVGGWAKVHFKTRKYPTYRRLRVERFQQEFGVWQDDAPGMICKCAEADALRSSFPTMLGGLYLKGEVNLASTSEMAIEISPASLVRVEGPSHATDARKEPEDDVPMGHAVGTPIDPPAPKSKPIAEAVQDQLAKVVTESGFTWDHLAKWGDTSGAVPDATKYGGFDDLPSEVCARLLRARTGLMRGLEAAKGGAQ